MAELLDLLPSSSSSFSLPVQVIRMQCDWLHGPIVNCEHGISALVLDSV